MAERAPARAPVRLTGEIARVRGAVRLAGAREAAGAREGLLLTVRGGGAWGQGEASPLPGYSHDDLAACAAALAAVRWDAIAAPCDAHEVFAAAASALGERGRALPAARACVEAALLDWLGRRVGAPAWALLGGAPARASLSTLVDLDADGGVAAAVAAARARGLGAVKLKVGRPGAWPRERAAVRVLASAGLAVRLDANAAWPVDEATARLAEVAPLGIELIEEPVRGGLLSVAASRRGAALAAAGVVLAADESLQDDGPQAEASLVAALATRRIGVLMLKPMALGLARCLTLARLAQAAGAAVIVTHLWDGPLGLALGATLALALAGSGVRVLPCGLDLHGGLAAWPAVELPFWRRDGLVTVTRPGLGLTELH